MTQWKYQVDIRPFWNVEGQSFEESRNGIVQTIRDSRWFGNCEQVEHSSAIANLAILVDELSDTEEAEGFNICWSAIYDIADDTGCWVKTF